MARPVRARTKRVAVAVAAATAVLGGLVPRVLDAWPQLENDTLDLRFAVRGTQPAPHRIVIVAVDDRSFDELHHQWPFPRRWDGSVIDAVHADGARAIAVDVQFTEPSDPTDDGALYAAVAGARDVVLATTEVDAPGQTEILGGNANLRAAHAVAAAANLPSSGDGAIRRYPYSLLGLPSFAVAVARAAGHTVTSSEFDHNTALIDFRGPPATFRTVSFADVLHHRVNAQLFRGAIVVIGATAPTLQDLHWTSTTTHDPMAGVEVQASAVWTALHDNPLRPAPGWLAIAAILLCALVAPLSVLRWSVLRSALVAFAAVAAYLVAAQVSFDAGTVLAVTDPIGAALLGTVGMLAASYAAAAAERNAFSRELEQSQLELVRRLAQAVESRDAETGEHTFRIGLLCHRLALELGLSQVDARLLEHASIAHDIGKIGIPDSILLKPGPLDAAEQELMRTHTAIGARLLAGSDSRLIRLAETIARTHHEWWDGNGYPDGLAGEEIPLAGRICAVVDVYDALVSQRHYKPAWRASDALDVIVSGSGTQFDPEVVTAFQRLAPRLDGELSASHDREQAGTPDRARSAPAPGVGLGNAPPPEATLA